MVITRLLEGSPHLSTAQRRPVAVPPDILLVFLLDKKPRNLMSMRSAAVLASDTQPCPGMCVVGTQCHCGQRHLSAVPERGSVEWGLSSWPF